MSHTPTQKPNPRATPRRSLAMALTLLFAFCVLITSAPHRHGDEGAPTRTGSHRELKTVATVALATIATDSANCPLCDWLYAPTIPAAAPVLPPIVAVLRGPVLQSSFAPPRLLSLALARSSSRAPPTV